MTSRPSLLLIPGLLCDAALWQNQINVLKDHVNCIVADTTRHQSVKAIAHDVLRVAPEKFILAGLSMGGYVALEIMRQAPERVKKLTIFDSSARPDTPEQKEKRRLLLAMSGSGHFKGVTPRLLPMLIHPERLADEKLTHEVMSMAERVGREAFVNQQTAILNRIDSRPFLKNIICPTLVVGGRQDAITPPDIVAEIAEGIKGAHLEIIEECGHLPPLERPRLVNALFKDWLGF